MKLSHYVNLLMKITFKATNDIGQEEKIMSRSLKKVPYVDFKL